MLLLIVALLSTAIWIITPSGSTALDRDEENLGMRLGLDLQGGSHLVYEAKFDEEWEKDERDFHLERAVVTIRDRIDKYGVAEPVIQQQGVDRILIQLPGITDVDEAKSLIEETGFLEFREVESNAGSPVTLEDYLNDESRTEFFDTSVKGKRVFGIVTGDEVDGTISLPYFLKAAMRAWSSWTAQAAQSMLTRTHCPIQIRVPMRGCRPGPSSPRLSMAKRRKWMSSLPACI